jgi:hypothetical protein
MRVPPQGNRVENCSRGKMMGLTNTTVANLDLPCLLSLLYTRRGDMLAVATATVTVPQLGIPLLSTRGRPDAAELLAG